MTRISSQGVIRINTAEHIPNVTYKYVIIGQDEEIVLDVDKRDIIQNADGELDCPLETVLRRNQYNFNDLNNWNVHTIQFIEILNGSETTLRHLNLNINL